MGLFANKDVMMNSSFGMSPRNIALIGGHWGWFFFFGLVLMVLGLVAISAATFTTMLSILLLGTLLMIGGIVMLVDTFRSWWKRWGIFTFHLLLSVLYIVAGFYLINSPLMGSISITLLLGVVYTVIGIVRLISVAVWRTPRWGWALFSGLISFLLGILILNNWPASSLFIIGLFVGVDLFIAGWTYLMVSLAAKSLVTP